MSYLVKEEIARMIGPETLAQDLDDNTDSVEDEGLFDGLAGDASRAVDAVLCSRYSVPFSDPVPPYVRECARVFLCELLYNRRGVANDANPWYKRAESCRARLQAIADGSAKLDTVTVGGDDSVEVVCEPARLSQHGRMLF